MALPVRYKPISPPFAGGMGAVIPCQDAVLDRNVAIKVIQDTVNRRRMMDELKALLKMRSKHVVQVFDVIQLDHDLGIVQEFIEGADLFDRSSAPTSTVELYKILWQIASGISDIHGVGVIHGDIKPNNMKIDSEGVVKIFDFGLARSDGPAASTVGFVGTRGFAAPELYAASAKFTMAVDTYAFGASALFLAAKRLPADLMAQPPTLSGAAIFVHAYHHCARNYENSGFLPCRATTRSACNVGGPRPLARHVLFDRHQALLVFQGKPSYVNAASPSVKLTFRRWVKFKSNMTGWISVLRHSVETCMSTTNDLRSAMHYLAHAWSA